MTIAVSYSPICDICKKPVNIESCTTDDNGKTVHGGCYFLKITASGVGSKKAELPMKQAYSPVGSKLKCPLFVDMTCPVFVSLQPSGRWESGNPASSAGFPSSEGKSAL